MFEKLNEKQRLFMQEMVEGRGARINLLQGSVRSGKTFVSLLEWIVYVAEAPEGSPLLMVGKTITSLKRNCLVLLESLIPKEKFSYSITKKEAVMFGKIVYLEGVNDARSEGKIRGMTLYGAYCDELTLFTEDFFEMLMTRLTLPNSKLFATTNPDTPTHWLMKKYIMREEELNLKIWNFYLDDNDNIPKSIIDDMKNEYTGVFYDRFILGKWVSAEGIIYTKFANNKNQYIAKHIPVSELQNIYIGIDYGASRSKTAFIAVGLTRGLHTVYVLEEAVYEGVNSPETLYERFFQFYKEIEGKYGAVTTCFGDWGGLGQVQNKGLQNYFYQQDKPVRILDCIKARIIDRINLTCRLIGAGRFYVHETCPEVIEAYCNAVWEKDKDDVRLDNGTVNIDVIDATEYALSSVMGSLVKSFNRGY